MGCCSSSNTSNTFEEILPGVHLSQRFKFYDEVKMLTTLELNSELASAGTDASFGAWCALNLEGKKREKHLYEMLATQVAKRLGHGAENHIGDFVQVPTEVTMDTLGALFRGNPFLASAIQVEATSDDKKRLCISSFTSEDTAHPNFFQKLTGCLVKTFDRFRIVLDDKLNVESVTSYRYSSTMGWQPIVLEHEAQVNLITSTLMFYFQCVHATIHIFHFMMVSGLYTVTRGNSKQEAFAAPFVPNLILKYEEVKTLLISNTGALVKGFCDGNRSQLLDVLGELLASWGRCGGSKQFVDKFLFAAALDAQIHNLADESVWVPEFRSQADLIPDFASDVSKHMQNNKDYAASETDSALKSFLADCGDDVFAVDGLHQWLELMSVTGMLHGCTLSLTRLTFTEANLWQMAPNTDTFNPEILKNIVTGFGTIVGLVEDREVFTDVGLAADLELKNVVQKHLEKSEGLKQAYKASIDMRGEQFQKWGWILTDYFPDLFDAKQLTITTYV